MGSAGMGSGKKILNKARVRGSTKSPMEHGPHGHVHGSSLCQPSDPGHLSKLHSTPIRNSIPSTSCSYCENQELACAFCLAHRRCLIRVSLPAVSPATSPPLFYKNGIFWKTNGHKDFLHVGVDRVVKIYPFWRMRTFENC